MADGQVRHLARCASSRFVELAQPVGLESRGAEDGHRDAGLGRKLPQAAGEAQLVHAMGLEGVQIGVRAIAARIQTVGCLALELAWQPAFEIRICSGLPAVREARTVRRKARPGTRAACDRKDQGERGDGNNEHAL